MTSDPNPQPPVQWSDTDDRAMDALLTEYFRVHGDSSLASSADDGQVTPRRSAGPRDFTDEILAKLNQSRSSEVQTGSNPIVNLPGRSRRKPGRLLVAGRVVAALAAAVLAIVAIGTWKKGPNQPELALLNSPTKNSGEMSPKHSRLQADGQVATAGTGPSNAPSGDKPSTSDGGTIASNESGHSGTVTKPRREPIVLSLDTPLQGGKSDTTISPSLSAPGDASVKVAAAPRTASLKDFDNQFQTYWKSLGVAPAPAVDEVTLANRIADRFGFYPGRKDDSSGSVTSPAGQVLQALASKDLFSTPQQSQLLAERLINQLSMGLGLSDQRKEDLVASASEVVRNGGRFDQWVSDWVATESVANPAAGDASSKAAVVGQWVVGRVVGADIGCARCHDSPIDSRYNQHDYWAVAALFGDAQNEPIFYEMLDGRQRVASPGAPARWLDLADDPDASPASRIESRNQFAKSLIGNRRLARSLANHLWTIGFGTPMVSAASSPIAPPRDDSIELALEMLSQQILASNFDIRLAAQWVAQSEPMKRGTPVELHGDAWQLANESQLISASLAQQSFAAARAPWPTATQPQLLAMMESRGGNQPAKLGSQGAILAQPIGSAVVGGPNNPAASTPKLGKTAGKKVDPQDYWWTQWLADRQGLRGGWMESITNRDQQLKHAFYAAGFSNVTQRQLDWAHTLIDKSESNPISRNEAIAKVYWIIQKSP
jgi:hypothetical protein